MGFSEIIAAISAVGISSFILALVKLLAFFRDDKNNSVETSMRTLEKDNIRWHDKYLETQNTLEEQRDKATQQQMLAARYRFELLTNGVSEERLSIIEKEITGNE